MASTAQMSLAKAEWDSRKRRTRRAEFLSLMDSVVPWADLLALVAPLRPAAGRRGRQPWPAETLLRMFLVQCWLNLSDEACEDACYDSLAVRDFVGCWDGVPDATTLALFRRLLEDGGLGEAALALVASRLEASGLMVRGGSVVDATIIEAPSSTKNASGGRDPEMHQARKGNQWHFGMKAHTGEDALGGYVHSASFTPANVNDVCEAHRLVRPDDRFAYADAGYMGVAKRPEVAGDPDLSKVEWRVAMRPGELRSLPDSRGLDREAERRKASVRARAEHPFQIVKRTFGYAKCRYRGIRKNAQRLLWLLASADLLMCARAGRQGEFLAPALAAA